MLNPSLLQSSSEVVGTVGCITSLRTLFDCSQFLAYNTKCAADMQLVKSQAVAVDINHTFHLYYSVVCGLSFSRSQPDFEGFF